MQSYCTQEAQWLQGLSHTFEVAGSNVVSVSIQEFSLVNIHVLNGGNKPHTKLLCAFLLPTHLCVFLSITELREYSPASFLPSRRRVSPLISLQMGSAQGWQLGVKSHFTSLIQLKEHFFFCNPFTSCFDKKTCDKMFQQNKTRSCGGSNPCNEIKVRVGLTARYTWWKIWFIQALSDI